MTAGEGAALPHTDVDLSISIVTWNNASDIAACLRSIPEAAPGLRWSVTVVDNGSSDGTADLVEREFPNVHLIRNTNVGFGAGHNRGMADGVGRFHLILNPDTVPRPGAFTTLVRYLESHPEVALVGPAIFERDGSLYPSCRSFPTAGALLFRNRILGRLFPKNPYTRGYLMEEMDHTQSASVDWLSGATLMAPRPALEEIGLLDDRFFMYCEDMDWCRRAHDHGFQVHYNPEAQIVHLRARSTDQRIPAMIIEHHRSMWKYYWKHELPQRGTLRPLLVALGLAARAASILAVYYLKKMLRRIPRQRS